MPLNFNTFFFGENKHEGPSVSGFSPSKGPLGTQFVITGARLSGVTELFLLHPEFADDNVGSENSLTNVEMLSSSTGINFNTGLVPDHDKSYVPEANKVAISGVIPSDFPRFPQRLQFRVVTSGFSGDAAKPGSTAVARTLRHETVTGDFIPYLDDLHVNENIYLYSGDDYESKLYTAKDSEYGYVALDTHSGQSTDSYLATGIILSSFPL